MGKRITAAYPIAKAGGIPINTSIPASKETYDHLGGRDVAFVVLHYTGNVSDTAEAGLEVLEDAYVGPSAESYTFG